MWEISIALVGILVALWLLWRWKNISTFSTLGIPGPRPNIMFGNIIELYQKGPLKCHEEWIKKYGRVLGYYYGMRPVLLVADPDLLKRIFIKDFSKFVDRAVFNPLNTPDPKEHDTSILTLKGQKWKHVRSILTPTFSAAKLKQMGVLMNSSIEQMLSMLKEKATRGEELNIHDTYQRLTMDVIAKTAFGVLLDVQTNPKSQALSGSQLIFDLRFDSISVFIAMCFPALRSIFFEARKLYLTLATMGKNPIEEMKKGIAQVIALRRNKAESRKKDILQLMLDTKISTTATKDINLGKLEVGNAENEDDQAEAKEELGQKRNMTDDEIISNSIVVFLAGYETTSTALTFATYLLSTSQQIQDKAYEEINELLKSGEKIEYATVNKLPYLDQVLNEAMRLYPPVYLFMNRIALEDVDYGDIKIPKGLQVQAPVYSLHHDPEYWKDPETFDPERFSTRPNSQGITYMPFGAGPRNCLGMRLAQMEAKMALAYIIHKFRILPGDKYQGKLHTTLRVATIAPTYGVKVKLQLREHETAL